MTGLGHPALAITVFLVSHSLAARPRWRHAIEARIGHMGFIFAYSALSLLLIGWVIWAVREAPVVVVWAQHPWMRWLPPLLMPIACVLAVAGLTTPNPFSIGPGRRGYDPARPGILRLTRHPVLWALIVWAAAHILPNGHAAGLMLFVPMVALAAIGPPLLDSRRRLKMGADEWARLAVPTIGRPDWAALLSEMGWIRGMAGLAIYGLLLELHPLVIGRNPLP